TGGDEQAEKECKPRKHKPSEGKMLSDNHAFFYRGPENKIRNSSCVLRVREFLYGKGQLRNPPKQKQYHCFLCIKLFGDLVCRFKSDGVNTRFELIDFVVVQSIKLAGRDAAGKLAGSFDSRWELAFDVLLRGVELLGGQPILVQIVQDF